MNARLFVLRILLLAVPGFVSICSGKEDASLRLIGVARIDVTPSEPIRLTGYAVRKTNSIGIEQKLSAKALAIGADADGPALLMTLDNCGIAEATYREVVQRLVKNSGIKQDH